ncbi:L-serine ammonia-lyase [Couchioplanes caeruleus]|uniref:L-serine dehydratase n=2 Tax=Couchioplanes caeruleus TaxID=56438 RepID=A0A1K0GJL9_9ACTN|nr:L-serine ammonia-lyase [Couchioplanes caeruleus]OJF09355.1 L-serine ammonia-lyase [Couchioplanes caeruleus subsp. caeruleus]ROP32053.1 L-serine ammonia-lyase [Couchioplanes caeruleus]
MAVSAFDLYSIGIGPSSSHTVGPMRAARLFAAAHPGASLVRVELFGSLTATGRGHGTDGAILLGLEGEDPAVVDPDRAAVRVEEIRTDGKLLLNGARPVSVEFVRHRRSLPYHPNALRFSADDGPEVTYYSVGGGFVVEEGASTDPDATVLPHPFATGDELLEICRREGTSVSGVMLANERAWRTTDEIHDGLLHIWEVMRGCVARGLRTDGVLPGGLRVRRRAPALHAELIRRQDSDPLHVMDWVNLFALAVNEENAAGGRVVTAPTNGAAGIVPAVLHYFTRFVAGADDEGVVRFLLTAAAIGILIKGNASLSGAEVGCQGEVGSAAAMAAGALCEVLGGTPEQVENAAEIALEHNLGLTCDPVGGLVQIPCIERNAIASVKAINAARLALNGDGDHRVSLDTAIRTMRDTGRDMSSKYKETSRGGLAVTVVEC